MQSQRLLRATSTQSICLFCLHRLQNQGNLGVIQTGRRSFVRAAWSQQQAATGTSFPDPDLIQPSPQVRITKHKSELADTARSQPLQNQSDGLEIQKLSRRQRARAEGRPKYSDAHSQWGQLRRRNVEGTSHRDNERSSPDFAPERLIKFTSSAAPTHDVEDDKRQSDFNTRRIRSQDAFVGLRDIEQRAERSSDRRPRWTADDTRQDPFPRSLRQTEVGEAEGLSMPSSRTGELASPSRFPRGPMNTQDQTRDRPLLGEQNGHTGIKTSREGRPQRESIGFPKLDRRGQRFEAPSAYDARPQRRGKEDKFDTATRRAEKFDFLGEDSLKDEEEGLAEARAEKERKKQRRKEKAEASKAAYERTIELPAFISVANLSDFLKVRFETFKAKLEELGFEDVAGDHVLNYENASLVSMEYNYQPVADRSDVADLRPRPEPAEVSTLPPRPPVVTIMGHVDHGKTTLLDYLRKSSVAAQEHGGITQHIGAFSVPLASGKLITFLDTPGHAAFLSMRQRGANVTDIVILVVAADDSVKPQTIEAIKHAKAANVPIIVAINKVDKDEANVERVKQDLMRYEVEVEDFGGDVQAYPVSGKTGQGLDDLVEAMVTQAEILDMRAETEGLAEGWVLEATTNKAGRIATVLVRRGTLRPGNIIVAGTTWARIRTLKNEAGLEVAEATPGTPVEVDGWRDQPIAGDEVLEADTEQKATSVVSYREGRVENKQAAKDIEAINEYRRLEAERREREKAEREAAEERKKQGADPEASAQQNKFSEPKETTDTALYFIVKADVSGSAEAIEESIATLPVSNHPVNLNVLRTGVGPVSEFDVEHASAVPSGNGIIVSFNQQVPPHISAAADIAGVRILDENIIYKVTDEIRAIIETKLPPLVTKRVLGEAEASKVFEINTSGRKFRKVAGSRVRNGVIHKDKKVRVYRGTAGDSDNLIYDGTISSLKSHKKDVREMRKGTECGISFEDWEDFEEGDIIQCYEEHSETRRLT